MSLEQYSKQLSSDVANTYGITVPWDQIIAIIMEVITNCFNKPKDFVAACKAPTVLQKVAMRIRVRQETGLRGREVDKVVDKVLADCAAMPDTELAAMYAEAKSAVSPLDYNMG